MLGLGEPQMNLSAGLRCLVFLLVASCAFAQSPELAEKSHRARDLMAAGKYEEAIPLYRDLVRALPSNPGLRLNLGMALHMAGHERQAIRECEAVLKISPGEPLAEFFLGAAYLSLGEPARAVEPLQKAVAAQPDNPDARLNLGEALEALERYPEATEQFRKLAELDAQNPEAWYKLGLCYQALARQSFDELAKLAPGSAYWLALAADSRAKVAQYSSAFYLYRQALDKMPTMRGVHAALADIYRKTGHPDWAATEEKRESDLGPLDCQAATAACRFQAGQYAELAATPAATPEAFYWKTRAYNQLAIQSFARLGELPPSPEYHELLANIHAVQHEDVEAAQEWQKAYELSHGDPRIGSQLAAALLTTGDNHGAQQLVEQLLKRQPDSPELNYLEGSALLNQQEVTQAIPHLEKAVARDPAMPAAHSALARAYLQTQQTAKAIPHLLTALPTDQDGSLHYQLARAYQMTGQAARAETLLKEYQQILAAKTAEQQQAEQEIKITPP